MIYKPYISLDIETTGLDKNDQVLQMGLVVDDLKTPVEHLFKTSFLIDNSDCLYTGYLDPVALYMNAWIFAALSGEKQSPYPIYTYQAAVNSFHDVLEKVFQQTNSSIVFAGKNVATFDLKVLEANGFLDKSALHARGIQISHRTIDVGSLYYPDFGYVPTSNELNQRLGRNPVTHDALSDALDVVAAIRAKVLSNEK